MPVTTRIRKCAKAERSQVPCDAELERPFAGLDRGQVQEDVLLDGQRPAQIVGAAAAAEDGAPDARIAEILESHQVLRYCLGGMIGGAIDQQVAFIARARL